MSPTPSSTTTATPRQDRAPSSATLQLWRKRFGLLLPLIGIAVAYPLHTLFFAVRPAIHTGDIYHAELHWFGISSIKGPVTLNEWFALHTSPVLDFITGASYVSYLLPSLLLFVYLTIKAPQTAKVYSWSLLILHLLAFTTYIVFPAAPPWYIAQHGTGPAILSAPPSAAGVARFDELIGLPIGHAFYANNKNVFGAIPSLHVGLQTLAARVAWPGHRKWFLAMLLFSVVIFFSAIYLNHHYLIDLLAGILVSILSYYIASFLFKPTNGLFSRLETDQP